MKSPSNAGVPLVCVRNNINVILSYITQDNGKLTIFNVDDPENLKLVGSYDHSRAGTGLSAKENVLYFAVRNRGILILDISDPASPILKSEIPVKGNARSTDVRAFSWDTFRLFFS